MKQKQFFPLSIAEMAISLFAANEGYLDDVEVEKVLDFEAALHKYLNSEHAAVADSINAKGDWNDEIIANVKACIESFKANGVY
jgi:F-type H+-transporting ATPase subunit alpha